MTDIMPNPRRWGWARPAAAPVDAFTGPADYDELAAPPAAVREIPMGEFTEREWAIFRQGQRWGWESRQSEVDAAWNAYNGADYDADRYYRGHTSTTTTTMPSTPTRARTRVHGPACCSGTTGRTRKNSSRRTGASEIGGLVTSRDCLRTSQHPRSTLSRPGVLHCPRFAAQLARSAGTHVSASTSTRTTQSSTAPASWPEGSTGRAATATS